MSEFPMNTRLFREGLDFERFYAKNIGEFGDEWFSMLSFAGAPVDDDIQYADCMTQLLGGFEGRILKLFGGLNSIHDQIDEETRQELSMGICKLFYLHKVADFSAYANVIQQFDVVLRVAGRRNTTANDQ